MRLKKSLFIAAALGLLLVSIGHQAKAQSPIRKNQDTLQESKPLAVSPYVDTHNHLIIGRGRSGDYLSGASKALDTMNRLGIEKMLVMPPPFSPGNPRYFDVEELLPVVRKFQGRFFVLGGGGSLNIMIHEAADEEAVTSELKRRFEERALEIFSKGAVGFGEFAVGHFSLGYDHPYESVPADHPLFLLLADIAAGKGVPIDIHMF